MAGAPESVDAGSWTAGARSRAERADAERGTGDQARSRDAETGRCWKTGRGKKGKMMGACKNDSKKRPFLRPAAR